MADPQLMTLVTAVIAVGFAVTILRNRMRSLSVAAIFVVGYVLSAVAQNTPELDNPAMPPNLKFPEPDRPAAQVVPNFESLYPKPDNPAMQTLKSLPPELLENPTTQAIPNPTGTLTPWDLNAKPEIECPYRTEELCDQAGCRNVITRPKCPD